MDVLRLNQTTFVPDELIEGYSSMIWTERYREAGDFELKTPYVSETRNLLPLGSLITLRDSTETMIVERHSIDRTTYGDVSYPELTIKGRSLDAFLENRILEGPHKLQYKMARNYTVAQAACVMLWNCLVNPTNNDVTRLGVTGYQRSVNDTIPNVVITNSTTVVGAVHRRWIETGPVYPQVIRYLQANRLGIRTIRPLSGPGRVVTVSTDDRGVITERNVGSISQLRFDVYNGMSRTKNTENPVIFSFSAGHIDKPTYLLSIENYKNVAYVSSTVGARRVFATGQDNASSGLDRRGLWVDGGQPEENEVKSEFLEDLETIGDQQLGEHERISLFDGEITPEAPYDFNRHYFLGDKVTLLGEYGFDETMIVAEYIRTEDEKGDRGYPGLAITL